MSTRYTSESSSSSRNQEYIYGELVTIPNCQCGQRLKLQTSWTNENPGRRYWECRFDHGGQMGGFVRWYDPPMCARSRRIIPGLLRRINRDEEEITRLKMRLHAMVDGQRSNGRQWKCTRIVIALIVICILLLVVIAVNAPRKNKVRLLVGLGLPLGLGLHVGLGLPLGLGLHVGLGLPLELGVPVGHGIPAGQGLPAGLGLQLLTLFFFCAVKT
nr:uncharacterized protein LOC109177281 [Ipomoea trifida]